jgi:AraC-like DNA-binding protein
MSTLLFVAAALAGLFSAYLATLRAEPRLAHRLLAAIFGLFALQSALSALQPLEPTHPLLWLRPLAAMLIGPLFYLHLAATTRPDFTLTARTGLHLTGPLGMLLARLLTPDSWYLDVMIALSVIGYAALIARTLTPATPGQGRWKRVLLAWLIAMLIADLVIGYEMTGLVRLDQSISMLITAAGLMIFFAYFLLTSLHQHGPLNWIARRIRASGDDPHFPERLTAHMHETRPWLDPDLTLARLARQLAVPQRQISQQVNDQHGVSVSRWINSYRIAEAQRLMQETPKRALIELMLDAGFQTKSNFNKAFKDETGTTPSAWRKANCEQ